MNPFKNAMADTFKMVADTQRQIDLVTRRAASAVKRHYRTPHELARYIEKQGTPVYLMRRNAQGVLARIIVRLLGYEPGFVAPPTLPDRKEMRRYQQLTHMLGLFYGEKSHCQFSKGVFVLPEPLFTVGYMAHQLHHWLAFLAGLPGYDNRDQELYRSFMREHEGVVDEDVRQMSDRELVRLKNAINREIEALKFIKQITEEIFRPANQAKNITNGDSGAWG